MFERIRGKFQDRAEKKAVEKLLKRNVEEFIDDAKGGYNATLPHVFEDIKTSPFYGEATRNTLLRAAIVADNVKALTLVLDEVANPNIYFVHHSSTGPQGPICTSSEHILYTALQAGSHDVALALVKNPRVAVDVSGYFMVSGRGGGFKDQYALPLTVAKQKEFFDVAEVIAGREARAARIKAAKKEDQPSSAPEKPTPPVRLPRRLRTGPL